MTEDFLTAWRVWRRDRETELAAMYGASCPTFPPDPRWIVTARYEPYQAPRWDVVDSADGHPRQVPVHGTLRFTLEETDCSLEPYSQGPPGYLNIAFRDAATNGAPRVIFPPTPAPGIVEVTLDFNRAINPLVRSPRTPPAPSLRRETPSLWP